MKCICAKQGQKRPISQNPLASLKMSKWPPCGTSTSEYFLPEKVKFLLGTQHQRGIPPACPFSPQGLFHSHTELQAFAFASTVTG